MQSPMCLPMRRYFGKTQALRYFGKTLSTSSIVPRFLFLGISADGVCFLKVTLAAKVFNVHADILSEVDDLVEKDEGEEHGMHCRKLFIICTFQTCI